MLVKDPHIVHPNTFELIQELYVMSELEKFVLVGGTALALHIGHRNSIDIDLFSLEAFNTVTYPLHYWQVSFYIDKYPVGIKSW